jgi:peptide/nickel transport system permease protein
VIERYGLWLGGVVQGDFGTSLVNGRPVVDAVIPRMRNTFILGAYAFILMFR